jgi:hypothetical protein
VLAVEELSRVDPSIGVLVDVQNTLVINALLRWGNDDIKQRFLPRLAADTVGAYALSEAGSGSDAFALTTRAEGRATATSSTAASSGSPTATRPTSSSSSRPSTPRPATAASRPSRGTRHAGLHRRQEGGQARHPRQQHVRTDPRGLPRGRRPNVLGEVGKGYKTAIETLNEGRIGIGAQMLGLARGALDHTIKYTKERKQFGKAIADFQGVQFQLARAAVEIEAATPERLQRRAAARCGPSVPDRSGDLQDPLVGGRRKRRVAGGQPLRRQRLRQGVPGREALPRRQDRPDLRRHDEPAARRRSPSKSSG